MIELQGVCKRYASVQAVQDLSFTAQPGEITGIIGPNGAGKSTTLRMILNIIQPDAGTIRVRGKHLGREMLSRVGYLPEERGLYKKTVVLDLLRYYAALRGQEGAATDKRILDWLERFDLADWKGRKVDELSKGMAQKVQFISCVAHDPDLMILDEPFSGLDPVSTEVLIQAMEDIRAQGKILLFSTHIMEHAEKLCQKIVMINHGREVCSGSLGDIQTRYGTRAVSLEFDGDAGFVASLPCVKQARLYARQAEVELHDDADADRLYASLAGRLHVRRFELLQPSLHKIFLDLAGQGTDPAARAAENPAAPAPVARAADTSPAGGQS